MAVYKQVQFPEAVTRDAGFKLVINREGVTGLNQAATDTLVLDQSLKIIADISDLAQEESDDEGFPVADAIDIVLIDRKNYSGTVNGSPVSETGLDSFIYDRLFTDKTVKYRAWIILTDANGQEKIFVGKIDPNAVVPDHLSVHKPYTTTEELTQIVRFSIISAVEDLKEARMGDVKTSIATSDCINREFYSGLTFGGTPKNFNAFETGMERHTFPPPSGWIHAAPYWTDAKGVDHDFSKFTGWQGRYNGCASTTKYWDKVHGLLTTPDISLGGSWGIKISKVIEKIATAANMDFTAATDLDSALDFYRQQVDNTNKEWDVHGTPYLATDLYISYNVWFGVHILNGAEWNNPVRFQDNETCLNALNRIADFLLADLRFGINPTTGNPTIKFVAKGAETGPIPEAWRETLVTSKGDAKESICDFVTVHNKQDDTKIKCPAGAQGDSREYIIPFRIRAWGGWDASWFSIAGMAVCPGMGTFDGKFKDVDQWKCFFTGSYNFAVNTGNPAIDGPFVAEEYWRGLCGVYVDLTGSNFMYPSNWQSVNDDTTWTGLYQIAMVLEKGAAVPSKSDLNTSFGKEFNSTHTHAQFFAKEKVGQRAVITRNNIGILADDGTFNGIEIGNTATFKYQGVVETFRLSGIRRGIKTRNSEIKIKETITFPTITELAIEDEGGDATTSSSSSLTTIINTTNNFFNDVYRVTTRKIKLFSGGTAQKTFAQVMIFETFDSTNSRWVAQYGFMPQYEAQTGATYGSNTQVFFHYKGTADKGNCYIEGLSPTGPEVPDYWFSGFSQFKHGTNDTDITYSMFGVLWSEDQNDFLLQRPLEAANLKRRIYVAGRFEVDTTDVGGWTNFAWKTLLSADWPISNEDLKTNIDKGYMGASAALPTLAAAGNFITLTWGARYKPVTIMAQAWAFNALDIAGIPSAHPWEVGANPVRNQQPNANAVEISFWLNNLGGGGGAWQHLTKAAYVNINGEAGLDLLVVDFWGTLEIIGDDASAL